MLPEGWKRCALGEVAQVTSGGTPDRSEPGYWGGNIPWVTTGEIQFNTITDTAEKITEAGLKNSSAKLFPAGTLLMAMYGQGKTRGQVAKLGIEAATNQACAAILLNEDEDTEFFFQFLTSHYEAIRELGNAGTQKNLSGSIIKGISVPVPPKWEQEKVARILATWDEAIAATEQLLANISKQKQTLMAGLLSGKRRFGHPEGSWQYIDFDEVFERVSRKNQIGNQNVLTISGQHGLISQRDYFNKSVASENLAGYTLLERYEFAYNKSYSAGYPQGAIKPLLAYDAGVVSSLYICFRIKAGMDADFDFFRHYFEAGLLNEEISGIAQEGARNHGLLNVSVSDFFKLRLHVPPAPVQRKIAEAINVAEVEERMFEHQLERLQTEKRALMQQLLTGKRRVRLADTAAEAIP